MKDNYRYSFMELNTRELVIDPAYQRPLDNTKIQNIINKFNPELVNIIKVSRRDGRYYVFDGQHTRAALIQKNGGNHRNVMCKVYEGLTQLDEMELFIAQNGASSPVSTADKFRARYNFGDEEITDMVRCCELAGVTCDFGKVRAHNKVVCYSTLNKYYKMLDRNLFIDMLAIIRSTWGGDKDSFSGEIVSGVGEFLHVYGDKIDRKRLVKKLSEVSPLIIVREGKMVSAPGGKKYARVILNRYNNRAKNIVEDRF